MLPIRLALALRSLAHRDFRLFLSGQLVSLIGTWMQSVGQSWLVLQLTDSPFRLGLVGALQFAPMLLFSFLAGAIADRVRKRRLILCTQTALMLQAFALALLAASGRVQYWHVAVLAALYGLANTLDMPTRQSFIVEMVGKEDLPSAIALNSTMFNGARIVGPALAGMLVDRYGVPIAFALNGVSFVAVLAALLMLETEGRPHVSPASTMRQDIVSGLRYALGTPRVSLVLGLVLLVSLFVINHNTLVPLLARDVLHQDAHGFGLLMAALGGGALVGALALAVLAGVWPALPLLVASALAASALTILVAALRGFWPAAAVLALIGFTQILFMATANTTLQASVPDRLRGRIMILYTFVFAGVTPFGAFFVGAVAELLGVPAAYALAGGLAVAGILTLLSLRRRAAVRLDSLDPE
jgi:MFS family permease